MLYMATGKLAHLGCKFVSSKDSAGSTSQNNKTVITYNSTTTELLYYWQIYNLSEPAYLWPYRAWVRLSPETCRVKAIANNKNAIVASCWTYFTYYKAWCTEPQILTAITSLSIINGLVFTVERECVYFAVRNKSIYEIPVNIVLSRVNILIYIGYKS